MAQTHSHLFLGVPLALGSAVLFGAQEEKASMRLNYAAIALEGTKALAGVNAALLRAGLNKRLMDLLFLRVSQINGCSYCVDETCDRLVSQMNASMASPDGERAHGA
jgi:alkylhydroperoxidase family enzyme